MFAFSVNKSKSRTVKGSIDSQLMSVIRIDGLFVLLGVGLGCVNIYVGEMKRVKKGISERDRSALLNWFKFIQRCSSYSTCASSNASMKSGSRFAPGPERC